MKKIFVFLILTVSVLSACSLQSTKDVGAIQTSAVQTVLAAQPTVTETSIPAIATSTATSVPVTTVGCTDSAQFVGDVTVPDDTIFKPDEIFIKTWAIKNAGTCTWTDKYNVIADHGDEMSIVGNSAYVQATIYSLSAVASKSTVAPGETVNISIPMQSNSVEGTYTTYWTIANQAGRVIPVVGGISGKFFSVQIKVSKDADGGAVGAITDVTVTAEQQQGSGAVCTQTTAYFVYVHITSNGPTTAQYRIDATDDSGQVGNGTFSSFAASEVQDTLTFGAAETKSVNLQLQGPYGYPDKVTIRVYVNGKAYPVQTIPCQ